VRSSKNRIRSVFLDSIKDLLFASFLFLVIVLLGKIIDVTNFSSYPTQSIPDKIYSSLIENRGSPSRKINVKDAIIHHGERDARKVALTFDADMTPMMVSDIRSGFVAGYYDEELVNILSETKTKATLFLSGLWIEQYPDAAKKLSQNLLFELANHTYSHPGFSGECYGLTPANSIDKKNEVLKTQELLKRITGFDNTLFRFPGGCYSDEDLNLISKSGQVAVQWDVAGQDGFNPDPQNIVRNVLDNVKNGSIIVLHMNGFPNEPATAQALPIIITNIRQRGYEFVTVSELLEEKEIKLTKYLDSSSDRNKKLALR
jgi:peptidoglycan-N-acetylglucosamine deacetylase